MGMIGNFPSLGSVVPEQLQLGSLVANAVAFLDANKQFKSTSALTFNGTTLTANALTVSNATTLSAGTANGVAYLNGSKVLTTGSALTFDGTNLGVGGTGGSYANRSTIGIDGTNGGLLTLKVAGTENARFYTGATNTTIDTIAGSLTLNPVTALIGQINGSERMRLDSSGNLGLGVTPSAWGSSNRALQVATTGAIWSPGGADTRLSNNQYRNSASSRVYIANGPAQEYAQDSSGNHVWLTAPSGTAGNAISFTQAMTLDASGNFMVGTTTAPQSFGAANPKIRTTAGGIQIGDYSLICEDRLDADSLCLIADSTENICFGGFNTGSSTYNERARIDSSGNLLAGATSGYSGRVNSLASSGASLILAHTGTAASGPSLILGYSDSTSTAAGTLRFQVAQNGNVTNSNNSYGAISDAKLKENVVDATPKLEKLNQVRVVNYNLIGSEQKQLGVIAQELEQVFPGMVDETPDLDKEGNDLGTTTKSVKYSVFVPMLIKAIQEQQAIIEQLKADVAALKGAA